jgi:hypothetical protein
MNFSFQGEVGGGDWHESRYLRTSNGGSILCGDEELAWCFRIHGSSMQVGPTTHVKFNVLPLKVKIKDLALIGCTWQ